MASKTLPKQMKVQVLEAYNEPYALKSIPLPVISSDDDLLIKLPGQMKPNPPTFPHIGSHEFAGTVVGHSAWPSTAAKQYSLGDRLGIPGRAYHPCGTCSECKDTSRPQSDHAGYSVFCTQAKNNGISRNGGFSEYAVVDARQVAPLPDAISAAEAAPLMCAGVTIYAALKRCGLSEGQRVGVVGAGGGLGHLGLAYGTAMGLRVLGVEAADAPLALAKSLDTKATIVDARTEEASTVVERLGQEDGKTDPADMGVDAVIILPESQASLDYGMKLLRNHGICVIVSFPENGFRISPRDLVFRDIRVVGSLVGSNATLREMLDFSAKHNIRARTKVFALDRLNALVEEYHRTQGGKLVVNMSI